MSMYAPPASRCCFRSHFSYPHPQHLAQHCPPQIISIAHVYVMAGVHVIACTWQAILFGECELGEAGRSKQGSNRCQLEHNFVGWPPNSHYYINLTSDLLLALTLPSSPPSRPPSPSLSHPILRVSRPTFPVCNPPAGQPSKCETLQVAMLRLCQVLY